MQDFVDNIENIDISNQMLSATDDHYLRRFAPLIPQTDYTLRLDKSLGSCFEKLAENASTQRLTDLLRQVLEFTRCMKVCASQVTSLPFVG